MISSVMPATLMSICSEVIPSEVPATLKSMSPRWSSSPRMSLITAKSLPSRIRPMAMPATGRFSGTPASISARLPPHTVAIDDRAVGLGDVGQDPDRIGELLERREHRVERPPGELAVAGLAPRRSAEAADFADRIGREVIVQHEALSRRGPPARRSSAPIPWCRVWCETIAWVSPRVNSAEPWVRGRNPTLISIGRTVLVSRPSIRRPSLRIAPRTTSASIDLTSLERRVAPAGRRRRTLRRPWSGRRRARPGAAACRSACRRHRRRCR